MRLDRQPRFDRAYKKLSDRDKSGVDDAIRAFLDDPGDNSLSFERLVDDIYSIRYSLGKRIILRRIGKQHFALLDAGPHNLQDQYQHRRKK